MPSRSLELLRELTRTDGIRESVVTGRDGFVIEHVGGVDSEAVGAIISTAIGAVEAMGRDSNQGPLFEFMAEFDDGVMIVAPIGQHAVLGIVGEANANLGRVRHEVKKNIRELERAI